MLNKIKKKKVKEEKKVLVSKTVDKKVEVYKIRDNYINDLNNVLELKGEINLPGGTDNIEYSEFEDKFYVGVFYRPIEFLLYIKEAKSLN